MDRQNNDSGANEDHPMYSRLFVVCDTKTSEDDLRKSFAKFGNIEFIRRPRYHDTGAAKGVAFIKFSKTSEAADALEAMHSSPLGGCSRPLKVFVAASRSEIQTDRGNEYGESDTLKYKRLFITAPKLYTENDIEDAFKEFGSIQFINIQRNKDSGESKGFAYVTFSKFSEAARAFEKCDKKFRAIFATPKSQKRHETAFESNIDYLASSSSCNSIMNMMDGRSRGFTRVNFMCWPQLTQGHVERLFDLVPGLVDCKYFVDLVRHVGKGTVTYSNSNSAAYAVDKLNNFEYPPGMTIFVKPDSSKFNSHEESCISKVPDTVSKLKNAIELTSKSSSPDLVALAEAITEASKLIKRATGGVSNMPDSNDINFCSVKLPPPQPLADIQKPVVKRCFLVCKPSPPPQSALRDVFCRFGDLIDVYTLPNKTVGYARFASAEAANEAMKVLHGAEICGIRMKVLEAEAEAPPRKRRHNDEY